MNNFIINKLSLFFITITATLAAVLIFNSLQYTFINIDDIMETIKQTGVKNWLSNNDNKVILGEILSCLLIILLSVFAILAKKRRPIIISTIILIFVIVIFGKVIAYDFLNLFKKSNDVDLMTNLKENLSSMLIVLTMLISGIFNFIWIFKSSED